MVRYFLTDLRGNPIYSFAQRLRRNNMNRAQAAARLSHQLQQIQQNNNNSNLHHRQQHMDPHDIGGISGSSGRSSSAEFVTTTLVCMIRNQAWDNVLKRIASHPHELQVTDGGTGNTVLHAACRLNPPAAVIQALTTTCPRLARHANREGATPLHIAASHRCSAEALQALLDGCKKLHHFANNSSNSNNNEYIEYEDDDVDDDKHTSPTADLSRMGRAPIHYACMSFRGLELDAFRLLLDATLQEGNVWVYEHTQQDHDNVSTTNDAGDLAMQDLYYSQTNGGNNKHLSMEEGREDNYELDSENDDKFDCQFTSETDKAYLYQQQSGDDLTVDSDRLMPPKKVLVNVMGMKDATGQTPLGLLFRRYRERVRIVINTVDRLRREQDNQDRAALVAAVRVHADLGELWEKARWIVARLTEERLHREQEEDRENILKKESDNIMLPDRQVKKQPAPRMDATSRRATYYGSAASSFYDSARAAEPPSPAEAAVAQEAASWAVEQHPGRHPSEEDVLPMAASVSTTMSERNTSGLPRPSYGATGRQFRIVHASVGLTGYGCPPELIRLAISIHPHQVTEMDEDGNLPLHIAVTAASYLATARAAAIDPDQFSAPMVAAVAAAAAGSDMADDVSVMSDAAMSFFSSATVSQTTNPFDKVIKILLQQYPEAARMPQGRTGRLPLVLAVESGRRTWKDGLRTLLNAYPPALHNKKVIEPELYPNVLALVANTGIHQGCAFDFAGGSIVDCGRTDGAVDGANEKGENTPRKTSKRAIRQEACSRTTLFELLRTKPEWLTRGFGFDEDGFGPAAAAASKPRKARMP